MTLSRRNFVKGVGLAASAACLPTGTNAADFIPLKDKQAKTHKILGCNIRVALPEDDAAGRGWGTRKDLCIKTIKAQKADIIGFQEVLRVQSEDLQKAMPEYFCFGFEGPEMDVNKETYNGIAKNLVMFSRKRYDLLSAGGYWLSETPEIGGSLSWNTARARHVNWVRLKDKDSGKEFRVLAIHLDHKEQEARKKQIGLMVRESAQYTKDFPQLLIGDFNVDATNPVYDILEKSDWSDTYKAVHGTSNPGPTFHNFQGLAYKKAPATGKIDFIFTKGRLKAATAAIIYDHVGELYPSDHFFINAEVSLV
jgi:endonuclease/exonuclease/phosphatase family metal-dependent hydrolase